MFLMFFFANYCLQHLCCTSCILSETITNSKLDNIFLICCKYRITVYRPMTLMSRALACAAAATVSARHCVSVPQPGAFDCPSVTTIAISGTSCRSPLATVKMSIIFWIPSDVRVQPRSWAILHIVLLTHKYSQRLQSKHPRKKAVSDYRIQYIFVEKYTFARSNPFVALKCLILAAQSRGKNDITLYFLWISSPYYRLAFVYEAAFKLHVHF